MINKLDVLVKSITLLSRENTLRELTDNDNNDSSKDLIKNILNTFKNDKKVLHGGDSLIISDLENLINDMITNIDKFNKDTLLQTLAVILKDKENVYSILEKAINAEMEQGGLKTSIISLRKFLSMYYKEVEIANLISKASYLISTNRLEVPLQEYIGSLITNLETLNNTAKSKDPGLLGELDFSNEDDIEKTVEVVKDLSENKGKFITGWKEVNRMINGKQNCHL